MILNADKKPFVSALYEEVGVGWMAASLKQPQGAMVWHSRAVLLLPALPKSPSLSLPLPVLTPAHGALCQPESAPRADEPKDRHTWAPTGHGRFLTPAVALEVEEQNLSVQICP